MNRLISFSSRVTKEILRDPLTLIFGLGFPVVLLLLLTAIQSNIPVQIFQLEKLTPGIAVFGYSFLTLFSAQLVSKDRSSAFLHRLFTTPLTASDYILGYTLPLIPMALVQCVICYIAAVILGLEITSEIASAIILTLPSALFFIGLGLLCGTLLNEKAVGGLCGALLTNLTAFLSGAWFDLEMAGDAFKTIGYLLPFAHSVDIGRAALAGNISDTAPHILWAAGYMAVVFIAAIAVFTQKMQYRGKN